MINKKKNYKYKIILIIGVGKWGRTLTNFFLQSDWNVMYATRDGKPNNEFELFFSSKKLSHFNISKPFQFDLISICVKPSDIFLVWGKYKHLSFKFLIEKPGAKAIGELKKIFYEAKTENKLVFINYEFNYSKTTIMLKEKFINSINEIKSIELFWGKPMSEEGGLEWRLLPHMLAELFFLNPTNLTISYYRKNKQNLNLDGYFDQVPLSITINESKFLNHYTTINLTNGGKLFKSREELLFNGKTVAKNSISTLDRVLHLLNVSDKNIFKENNYISEKVLNLIEQLK